jgi:hypothetical protein
LNTQNKINIRVKGTVTYEFDEVVQISKDRYEKIIKSNSIDSPLISNPLLPIINSIDKTLVRLNIVEDLKIENR